MSSSPTLRRADLDRDPLTQVIAWVADADAAGLPEPTAMALATAAADGTPACRMVLFKGRGERGLCFFTNTESRKASELAANPRAALTFFWAPLHRQARLVGRVERLPDERARSYFQSRSRGSQVGAWSSPQSRVLADRAELENRVQDTERRFEGHSVLPLPPHWGGYELVPHEVELWLGRRDRLHDRFRYSRSEGGSWRIDRLAP